MADDLPSGGVQYRDLALDDRDERVARITDAVEQLAGLRGPLLADPGQGRKLRRRQRWGGRGRRVGHGSSSGRDSWDTTIAAPARALDDSHRIIALRPCRPRDVVHRR
jgi:hypothetical protein